MKKILAVFALLLTNQAFANECELSIEANDAMQFSAKELSAPASCKEVTLTLKHTGKLAANVMGHNWVLTKTADVAPVANAGMAAGAANNYVPAGDAKVIAFTKVIGGGESTSVTFPTAGLAGQDLTFFCSFPGHWAIMKGKFAIK